MKSYYLISSLGLILLSVSFLFLYEIEKPKHQFNWTNISTKVKDSVLVMAEYNEVTSRFIGYSANESQQYFRAKWFKETATDQELHQLIKYQNGTIKAYSFDALLKRKDPFIFDYIVNSFNDDTIVFLLSGCVGQEFKIFEYYTLQVTPPFAEESFRYSPRFNFSVNQKEKLNQLIELHNSNSESFFELNKLQ